MRSTAIFDGPLFSTDHEVAVSKSILHWHEKVGIFNALNMHYKCYFRLACSSGGVQALHHSSSDAGEKCPACELRVGKAEVGTSLSQRCQIAFEAAERNILLPDSPPTHMRNPVREGLGRAVVTNPKSGKSNARCYKPASFVH
jgi:hypothetical protein